MTLLRPDGRARDRARAGQLRDRLRGRRPDRRPPRPPDARRPQAGLLFAAGAALLVLTAGSQPQFLAQWLPACILAGTGVGAGMTAFAGAAAASLPAHALGAGGAINISARQIGAMLGVAVLVAILGSPASTPSVTTLQAGWSFSALAATTAGAIALCLGRARRAAQTTDTPDPNAITRSAASESGALQPTPALGRGPV